jgi:hypothetical protein
VEEHEARSDTVRGLGADDLDALWSVCCHDEEAEESERLRRLEKSSRTGWVSNSHVSRAILHGAADARSASQGPARVSSI